MYQQISEYALSDTQTHRQPVTQTQTHKHIQYERDTHTQNTLSHKIQPSALLIITRVITVSLYPWTLMPYR